jgi:hypothetical protein
MWSCALETSGSRRYSGQTGGAVSGWTAFDIEQVSMLVVALPRIGVSGVAAAAMIMPDEGIDTKNALQSGERSSGRILSRIATI